MRCLNRRNSAMTSEIVAAWPIAAASAARASVRWVSGSRNRQSARPAGSRKRQRSQIGRGGKGGVEQLPDLGRLVSSLAAGASSGGAAKRLGDGFERVGAPRRVVDARAIGDALEERRHAGLISAPMGPWGGAPLTSASPSIGKARTTLSPGPLSSSLRLPPCSRATAATRLNPSPLPGSDRLASSRTKRPSTRSRSEAGTPGPRSVTTISATAPLAAGLNLDLRRAAPLPTSAVPYLIALSIRLAMAWPSN